MIGAEHLDKELEVSHKSVRVINNGLMEIEPDQQHVPQLLEDLGVTQSDIVKTPRVKLSVIEAEAIENSPILEGRQNYGAEPCDVRTWRRTVWTSLKQSSVLHERCRNRKPGHMTQLKRVARYLKGVPRKALQYPLQEPSRAHLIVHVDSDWAGDTATRRSRSGVIVRRGLHLLRRSSTAQNVLGLSSAESEYHALTKGGCSGLRLQSLFAGWNLKLTTLIAYGLFEREGSCFAMRSWQEHSSKTDEDAMATGTCGSSKTLASCESGNGINFCRTSRRKDWSDRTSCGDGGQETQGIQQAQEILQLKRWKRVMQRSRTNRMMRSQRLRTSRRMHNCDGCILWIEFSNMVESRQWTS